MSRLSSGLPGDDGRPGLAAAEHGRPRAQVEAALLPARPVADGAAAQQDGEDVVLRQRPLPSLSSCRASPRRRSSGG